MKRQSTKKLIAAAIASVPALFITQAGVGQTFTWTGNDGPLWNDTLNWNPTTVPGTGATAEFASTSNSNNNVSLNGGTQAIGTILFDSTPTSFNLGTTGGDTFVFDPSGAITVNSDVSNAQTISAAIQTSGGMTITENSSSGLTLGGNVNMSLGGLLTIATTATASTTQFNGNITDGGGSNIGSLALSAIGTSLSNSENFIFNGTDTYSGTTSINVNTGSNGSIQIGTDSPFGTSKVFVNIVTGTSSPQFQALGGTRTISNAMDLNSGLTFIGSNGFNFNGPINIINATAGGTNGRTLNASVSGEVITFGSTSSASTITLGNPVSNGGDGTGKTLTINVATGSMVVINDVMQDPGTGGGTASGSILPSGLGTVRFVGQSTYTGTNNFNNGTILQIASSSMLSTSGAAISGPLGLGTVNINNTSTNPDFQAVGTNQTIANPINISSGMLITDAPTSGINADPVGTAHNLTFSGPVLLVSAGRNLNFNNPGTTFSFGSSTSPSTFTLSPNTTAVTLNFFVSNGATVVMNDVVQDNPSAPNAGDTMDYQGQGTTVGTIVINAQNTYGGPTLINGTAVNDGVMQIGTSSVLSSTNVTSGTNIVSGPFGRGTVTINETGGFPWILQAAGSNQVVANPFTFTLGSFFGNVATNSAFNLTLSGPLTMGGNGKTFTNLIIGGHSLSFGLATNPATFALGTNQVGFQTQSSSGPGGGVTIINDLVTGSGTSRIVAQGNVILQLTNANNSFTGGITATSGATVSVSADGDLGTSSANVIIGNATLLSTGTFSSARNITLSGTGTNVNTIDVTGTNTLTLNGLLSGSGALTKGTNTGTLVLGDASNSYASTVIDGGTLSVSVDGDLNNSGGAVTLSAPVSGTLLSTGTFTSARTINLNGTVNTIDATGTNTLTLISNFGGSGDLTKGTNAGTVELDQSGGYSPGGNVNVNGGTLALGSSTNGGAVAPLSVGGTLTINGGKFAVLPSGATSYGLTNTASTLTINGSGQLDLANSSLVTTTSASTIRQYLIAGYNGGASNGGGWNGTGGISSVNAAASTNHLTALGYSTGTHSALGIALGLASNQTVVKYTIYGDANLDGSVDISDLDIVLSNYASGKPPTWDTGDFTYAGQTDITDLNIVLSNYAKTAPTSVATPSVARSSVKTAAGTSSGPQTLTGTVSPAVASGAIELDVNTITGDAVLNPNNVKVVSLQVASSSGNLIPNNWKDLSFYYGTTHWADSSFQTINLAEYDTAYTSRHDSLLLTAPVDYGDIFNTSGPQDLTFEYGVPDADGSDVDTEVGAVVYSSGVPEPTTLGLMGLAMAGLMGRRRKSKQPK